MAHSLGTTALNRPLVLIACVKNVTEVAITGSVYAQQRCEHACIVKSRTGQ